MVKFNFENKEICSKCGGMCCKRLPGCCYPSDIKRLFPAKTLEESVLQALRSNKFCIDWYEDDKPLYFMRPCTKGKEGAWYDPSWGGVCVFLEETGCSLEHNKRPYVCRSVEPRRGLEPCPSHLRGNSKLVSGRLWKRSIDLGKFQEIVGEAK
jgi:hypothetical protein